MTVRYLTRVCGLVRDRGRVCGVDTVTASGQESRVPARLVVGADGAASVVRRLIGLELPARPYDSSYFGINFERPRGYRDGMRLHLHPEGGMMIVPNRPGMVGAAVLVRAAGPRAVPDGYARGEGRGHPPPRAGPLGRGADRRRTRTSTRSRAHTRRRIAPTERSCWATRCT